MHIYDFLTDQTQQSIKKQVRSLGEDRFEHILDSYKQRFMQSFERVGGNRITLNSSDEPRLLADEFKSNTKIEKWFEKLLMLVLGEGPNLERIFDGVIDCYLLFVRGRRHTAVLTMYDILEKYEMLDEIWDGNLGLFFRCTVPWEGANLGEVNTYNHLPFNLRSKVKNQRFSVSGMPMWYGGASLLASYYEMRKTELVSHPDLAISAWAFDLLAGRRVFGEKLVRERKKVFDITNNIYDMINSSFAKLLYNPDYKQYADFLDSHPRLYQRPLRIALRKFAVSNLCTFIVERPDVPFYEEYVIPQILTEAVRLHKYDGILFPSTRFDPTKISFKGRWHTNFYKSNLTMFTEYDYSSNYDEELGLNFGKLIIKKEDVDAVESKVLLDRIATIVSEIVDFLSSPNAESKFQIAERYLHRFEQYRDQIEIYSNLNIEGVPYLDTYVGKAEIFAIADYLNDMYRQIKDVLFQIEFDDYLLSRES